MGAGGKLAVGGLLAGLMAVIAAHSALHRPAAAPVLEYVEDGDGVAPTGADISHCRAITIPDPVCGAAWEARRKAFFGEGVRP